MDWEGAERLEGDSFFRPFLGSLNQLGSILTMSGRPQFGKRPPTCGSTQPGPTANRGFLLFFWCGTHSAEPTINSSVGVGRRRPPPAEHVPKRVAQIEWDGGLEGGLHHVRAEGLLQRYP